MYPDELFYSEEHEWVKVEGDICTIGISQHAQEALGDIVFVELPEVGETVEKNDTSGSIESVKAVSDIFCPVSGEIVEVNEALEDAPETVNNDPYGEGWIFKIRVTTADDLESLMNAKQYQNLLEDAS